MGSKLTFNYFVCAVVVCVAMASVSFAADPTVTTDKKHYSVGETMVISGTGFTPGGLVIVSVLRPDHVTDYPPAISYGGTGGFSVSYTPPPIPGRYKITATDGANSATTATTEADAFGYNKGVYNKSTNNPDGGAGVWTTGNAGNNYTENQWVFYQYQVTGVTTTIPDFDISFNHYQSNSNAIFIDGFSNFRVCLDDCTGTNPPGSPGGTPAGMLANDVPYPPDTTWQQAQTAMTLINRAFVAAKGNNFVCGVLDGQNAPSESHCFHVDGAALQTLINTAHGGNQFTGPEHTITVYYEAHLSQTSVWSLGHEYLLGCSTSAANYAAPRVAGVPVQIVYGTNAYNQNADPCTSGGTAWNGIFQGVGAATGSSRHFTIQNQSGPQGDYTLPIPTVLGPSNGSITIIKTAIGGDDTFSYSSTSTVAGLPSPADASGNFSILTSGGTGQVPFPNIPSGTYTVTELPVPAGWGFTSLSCVATGTGTSFLISSATATITLAPLGDVTCTYTNTKRGSITIIKDAVPNDAQDFAYTVTGAGLSPFSLDDDADGTLPNSRTFDNLVPGPYSVTESGPPAGWQFTNLVCSAGGTPSGQVANITLAAGASVTCTYTNTKDATLTIVKDAVPNDAQDFAYTTTGTGPALFTGGFSEDDDADGTLPNTRTFTFSGNQLGAKTVIEGAVAGWTLTNLVCSQGSVDLATRTASVTLAAGDAATCTYTNTKEATLTIVKDAVPNDAQDFGFTATGTGPVAFTGGFSEDDDADGTLPNTRTFTFSGNQLGAKTVIEGAVAGWTLTNLVCSQGSVDLATRTASVTLAAGDAATCTYTNTKEATLTIVKDAVPNDAQDFGFTATGTGPVAFTGGFSEDDDADGTLPNTRTFTFNGNQLGAKTVIEGAVAGWTLTNLVCSQGSVDLATRTASVTLAAGDAATCTYTNTKEATLTIVKDAVPNDAQDFGFTATGTGPAAFTGGFSEDDDADGTLPNTRTFTFNGNQLGAKTVIEGAVAGWTLTNLVCSQGSVDLATRTASVTLAAGDAATCTYTNTKEATLTIVKDAVPNDAQDFGFTATGTGPVAFTGGFSEDDDADGTLPNTRTFTFSGNQLGAKTVIEGAVAGWTLTNLVCSQGSVDLATRTASVTLAAGDAATCTYTNTKEATLTIVKDAVPNDAQDFGFTATGTGPAAFTGGFSEDDDADGTLPNTRTFTFNGNQLGAKTVIEGAVAGWTLTNLVCSQGSVDLATRTASVTLAAGDAATCTYTNTKDATLTIVKDAVPNDAQDFGFTATGTGPVAFTGGFSEDDDADGTLPNTRTFTFSGNQLGAKTVIEGAVAGWTLTNLVCSQGSVDLATRTASVTLAAGDAATCTYTNTKLVVLRIVKSTVPDGDTTQFTFTPTNWYGGSTFTRADNQAAFVSSLLMPGTYSAAETVPEGWVLTGRACVFTGTATGHAADISSESGVSVLLLAGEDVTCTFTDSRLPTLIVRKTIQGNSDTFHFDIDGTPDDPPSPAIDLTPNANSSVDSASQIIQLGSYIIGEVLPQGWLLTDKNCTGATSFTPSATGGTFTAGYGDNVLCSFVDSQQGGATRTQGFWATHNILTNAIWNGTPLPEGTSTIPATPVTGTADAKLCTGAELTTYLAGPPEELSQVLGGFWAGVSQKSTGKGKTAQRADIDQARMQLLQQYLAAVLNSHAFGTPISGTTLEHARDVYCFVPSSNPNAIKEQISFIREQMGLLATYNQQGDNQTFTPGASATPTDSKDQADIPFWDTTIR